ncbi:hypothetical protein DFH06DRAFT_1334740 [Mycena polygramma]|nr:hypothetical protein DFH06DRAFT_1334740 [Mycena polygramma]
MSRDDWTLASDMPYAMSGEGLWSSAPLFARMSLVFNFPTASSVASVSLNGPIDIEPPVQASTDFILFEERFDHYTEDERCDVWSRIMRLALPDGHNDPVKFANVRSDIAALCKSSKTRTYEDEGLWNTLYINQHILPEKLRFVLDKCPDAPLRIRIALIDVRIFPPASTDVLCAECLVDRIFDVISSTAHRWSSFYLHTEHPGAFLRVQERCSLLSTPNLRSVSISYGHLPGYSEYDIDDPIYGAPMAPANWFEESIPKLDHLDLQSVYFPWTNPLLFSNVTCVDLSRLFDVDWTLLRLLFSSASNLRFLRLDCIDHCAIPAGAILYSSTLVVLDIGLEGTRFMSDVLRAIVAPELVDLTLREVNRRMEAVLACSRLLGQLTRFAVFGLIIYDHCLEFEDVTTRLFNALVRVKYLDFHNARADLFAAYCSWTYVRGACNNPIPTVLEALYIGFTPLDGLLEFLIFYGINEYTSPLILMHSMNYYVYKRHPVISRIYAQALTGLLGLPFELISLILEFTLGSYFEHPVDYVRHRSICRLVCRQLHSAIQDCHLFWNSYIITPGKSYGELKEWGRNMAGKTLSLSVRFDNAHTSLSLNGRACFTNTLMFFLRHVPACRVLSISVDDFHTLPIVSDGLPFANVSLLEDFTFIRFASVRPYRVPRRETVNLPFPGDAAISAVHSFRLFGIGIHWHQMTRFVGLTVLVLQDLYRRLAPTADQLVRVLRSNPSLVKLSLHLGIACPPPFGLGTLASIAFGDGPSDTSAITLPCLTHLDVALKGDKAFAQILSILAIPKLNLLHVAFSRPVDVDAVISMRSTLSSVETFIAAGYDYESIRIKELFSSMPLVTELEVAEASPDILRALQSGTDVLFPLLSTLTLTDLPLNKLRDVVEARLSAERPLRTLNVHYPYVPVYDCSYLDTVAADCDDILWLLGNLVSFVFNPSTSSRMNWATRSI